MARRPCRDRREGYNKTMQNAPKNGAFFAVKLRPRGPTRTGARARPRAAAIRGSPPHPLPHRPLPGLTGGHNSAHTRGENFRGQKYSSPGPASNVSAHRPAGRERETRTQRADAIRGRAAQLVRIGHRAQPIGGRPPAPAEATPHRPAPKYPRRKPQPGRRLQSTRAGRAHETRTHSAGA